MNRKICALSCVLAAVLLFSLVALTLASFSQAFRLLPVGQPISGRFGAGRTVFLDGFQVDQAGIYEIRRLSGVDLHIEVIENRKDAVETVSGHSYQNQYIGKLKTGRIYQLRITPASSGDAPVNGPFSIIISPGETLAMPRSGVNTPILAEGMSPIIFDEKGTAVPVAEDHPEWYDYSRTVNRWANGMRGDGSQFVWIPRYATRIDKLYSDIEVKFLDGLSDIAIDGTVCRASDDMEAQTGDFVTHPAFTLIYPDGERKELAGIWIAKYQASKSGQGNAVFAAGRKPWVRLGLQSRKGESDILAEIDKMNTPGYSMRMENAEAHLLKSSEWAAAAYLSFAYLGDTVAGTQGLEILTGGGDAAAHTDQSTTGNIYGIYDMAGGMREYTAALYHGADQTAAGGLWELQSPYVEIIQHESGPEDRGTATTETEWWTAESRNIGWGANNPNPIYCRGGMSLENSQPQRLFGFVGKNAEPDGETAFRIALWVEGEPKERERGIQLEESDDILVNPGIGRTGNALEYEPDNMETLSIIHASLFWADIEQTQGTLNTAVMDDDPGEEYRLGAMKLDYWRSIGKPFMFELIAVNPGDQRFAYATGSSVYRHDVDITNPVTDQNGTVLYRSPYGFVTQEIYDRMADGVGYTVRRHKEIPDWLYDALGPDSTGNDRYASDWLETEGDPYLSFCYYPDYANPVMLAAHERLLSMLYDAYGGSGFLYGAKLGSIGNCGEWNGLMLPNPEVAVEYVRHYSECLPGIAKFTRSPDRYSAAFDFGFRENMVGFQGGVGAQLYKLNCGGDAQPKAWLTVPVTGELGTGYENIENPDGSFTRRYVYWYDAAHIEHTLLQIKKLHMSSLGFGTPGPSDNPVDALYIPPEEREQFAQECAEGIKRIYKLLGYRLWVSEITGLTALVRSRANTLRMTWQNTGSAPMYENWDVEISLIDSGGDVVMRRIVNPLLSGVLPDAPSELEVTLYPDAGLAPGTYTLAVAVLDPATGEPGLQLANRTRREDGRYALTDVVVR